MIPHCSRERLYSFFYMLLTILSLVAVDQKEYYTSERYQKEIPQSDEPISNSSIIRLEGRTNYRIYYRGSRKPGEARANMKDMKRMISQAVKLGYGENDREKCECVRPKIKLSLWGVSGPDEGPKLLPHMAPIPQQSDSQMFATVLL